MLGVTRPTRLTVLGHGKKKSEMHWGSN